MSARPWLVVAAIAIAGCGRPSDGRKTWPGPFQAVAAGDEQSCALDAAGAVRCWGQGASPAPAGPFQAVVANGPACALRTNGEIACWARGATQPAPPGQFVTLALGHDACAIDASHHLTCWLPGEATYCVKDPDGGEKCAPMKIHPWEPLPGGTFTRVAVSSGFGCAIRTDGALQCWGTGWTFDRHRRWTSPGRAVPPSGAWIDVAGGSDFFCALAESGTVACWSDVDLPEMQPPRGVHFTRLTARGETACGLDDHGDAHCWGRPISWYGTDYDPPAGPFDAISLGRAHACARRTDGQVACWGVDQQGQVTGQPPSLWYRN